MRAIFLLLLVAMCSRPALGLQCHTCFNSECSLTNCSLSFNTCFKATVRETDHYSGKSTVTERKGCVSSCEWFSRNFHENARQSSVVEKLGFPKSPKMELKDLKCCDQDLCNRAAPTGRILGALAGGLLLLWALL